MAKLRTKSTSGAIKTESNEITPKTEKDSLWETLWGGVGKCEIPISDKQKIIISLTKNNETEEVFVDIRQYVLGKKYTGLTSKGVTIPVEDIQPLRSILAKADKVSTAKAF